ncbi:MAG: hypothetical protein NTV09_13345, partial [Bacteroidetes bacterium]|nr:hypothetical protein [Bacteroidota bacterium]
AIGMRVNAQQNTYPIISTYVETACIAKCFDADNVLTISDSSIISVIMTIQLFEFTGISSLHVKLGTTSGGSDLLDKTFSFDVSGSVGNGCTYSRNENTVTLGLGSYNGLTSYFSEVKLERDDHSLTDSVVLNR